MLHHGSEIYLFRVLVKRLKTLLFTQITLFIQSPPSALINPLFMGKLTNICKCVLCGFQPFICHQRDKLKITGIVQNFLQLGIKKWKILSRLVFLAFGLNY
jgi:hypothetical protein